MIHTESHEAHHPINLSVQNLSNSHVVECCQNFRHALVIVWLMGNSCLEQRVLASITVLRLTVRVTGAVDGGRIVVGPRKFLCDQVAPLLDERAVPPAQVNWRPQYIRDAHRIRLEELIQEFVGALLNQPSGFSLENWLKGNFVNHGSGVGAKEIHADSTCDEFQHAMPLFRLTELLERIPNASIIKLDRCIWQYKRSTEESKNR